MRQGVKPIVIDGTRVVPEYPTYWPVPDAYSGAIDNLVKAGQVDYEPFSNRGANGAMAAIEAPPIVKAGRRR